MEAVRRKPERPGWVSVDYLWTACTVRVGGWVSYHAFAYELGLECQYAGSIASVLIGGVLHRETSIWNHKLNDTTFLDSKGPFASVVLRAMRASAPRIRGVDAQSSLHKGARALNPSKPGFTGHSPTAEI